VTDKPTYSANPAFDNRMRLLEIYDNIGEDGKKVLLQFAADLDRRLAEQAPTNRKKLQ